jgi:hypothetical protein
MSDIVNPNPYPYPNPNLPKKKKTNPGGQSPQTPVYQVQFEWDKKNARSNAVFN